jgi:hypothetical protein
MTQSLWTSDGYNGRADGMQHALNVALQHTMLTSSHSRASPRGSLSFGFTVIVHMCQLVLFNKMEVPLLL